MGKCGQNVGTADDCFTAGIGGAPATSTRGHAHPLTPILRPSNTALRPGPTRTPPAGEIRELSKFLTVPQDQFLTMRGDGDAVGRRLHDWEAAMVEAFPPPVSVRKTSTAGCEAMSAAICSPQGAIPGFWRAGQTAPRSTAVQRGNCHSMRRRCSAPTALVSGKHATRRALRRRPPRGPTDTTGRESTAHGRTGTRSHRNLIAQ